MCTDCNGCSGDGTDGGIDCYDMGINVYACRGTFSNGMEDSSTLSICNTDQGYNVCRSARDAASSGLTSTLCGNLPGDELYFSQETSPGSGKCYTDHPELGNKTTGVRNDVWCCGGSSLCHITPCYSTLTRYCGSGHSGTGFSLGSDGYYEYDYVEITNRSRGGVLCCKTDNTITTTSTTTSTITETSETPSIVASGIPTMLPTLFPTDNPSRNPTENPSAATSAVPTEVVSTLMMTKSRAPTTSPHGKDGEDVDLFGDVVNRFGLIVTVGSCFGVFVCCLLIIGMFICCYKKKKNVHKKSNKNMGEFESGSEFGINIIKHPSTTSTTPTGVSTGICNNGSSNNEYETTGKLKRTKRKRKRTRRSTNDHHTNMQNGENNSDINDYNNKGDNGEESDDQDIEDMYAKVEEGWHNAFDTNGDTNHNTNRVGAR